MSLSIEQITEEALLLPSEDRMLLADRLLQSVESHEHGKNEELWFAEIDRRLAEVDSGKVTPISGTEAFAQVCKAVGR